MKELNERKKVEILRLFLEGYSYDQISTEADIGKGTVVNVVNDFRAGRFPAFSDVGDLVDTLRELAAELKKRNAGASEALLGLAFFSRLDEMGVKPADIWSWAEMCRNLTSPEANQEEFMSAALELFRLKQETDESYPTLAVRCSEARTEAERLRSDIERLRKEKAELESTNSNLAENQQELVKEKGGLQKDISELSSNREQLRQEITDIERKSNALGDEVTKLEATANSLRPEVNALEGLGVGVWRRRTGDIEGQAERNGFEPGFYRGRAENRVFPRSGRIRANG